MPQKRTYILFALSIVILAVSFSIFFFTFSTIKKKNENASMIFQSIQYKLAFNDNASNLKKIVEDTKEKYSKLKSYVVDQDKISNFVNFIEDEGELIGVPVTITLVNLSNKNVLSVSFTSTSSFGNTMRLLSMIENSPYQIKIKKVYLNATQNTDTLLTAKGAILPQTPQWNATVDFDTISNQFE